MKSPSISLANLETSFKLPQCFSPHRPFSKTPNQNTSSHHNALLSSHIRANDPTSTLLLFHRMRTNSIPLDSYTFPPVLSACSSLLLPSLGRQLHALMAKSISHSSPIPATALLDMYSKCDRPLDALHVFDEMPVRDVVAWNSLISCFVRRKLATHAFNTFRSMVESGVSFTDFTLCTVLKACTESHSLQQGKQIHAWITISGYNCLIMGTALIDFYSSCGAIQDSLEVFNGLNCTKDVAIYNALISGFVLNRRYEEAFLLLKRMKPNGIALTCALNACSDSLNLASGMQIHCVIVRCGFDYDTVLCNTLLDMYAKGGEIKAAHLVFDQIGKKNVVSWTSIIDAYGSHGLGIEALQLFKKMEEEEESSGVLPNEVTFLSVLSACGHSGLVEEGRGCFLSMRDKYGLDPGPEHYACYIDLLGRAGKIEAAWDVFCSVNKLTSGVCVAMLNSCKVSMDLVRGEIVVQCLLELDSENPGSYVLISNFYADVGRWEGVEDLRRAMGGQGLRKEVGSSKVAV